MHWSIPETVKFPLFSDHSHACLTLTLFTILHEQRALHNTLAENSTLVVSNITADSCLQFSSILRNCTSGKTMVIGLQGDSYVMEMLSRPTP